MTNGSGSGPLKQVAWRIVSALFLNATIVIVYTLKYPPHPKMGHYFAIMAFGFFHLVIGIAVALIRVPGRSLLSLSTMVGNLVFAFYLSGFMIDYTEPGAAIHLVFGVPGFLLGFGLAYRAYWDLFSPGRESL